MVRQDDSTKQMQMNATNENNFISLVMRSNSFEIQLQLWTLDPTYKLNRWIKPDKHNWIENWDACCEFQKK